MFFVFFHGGVFSPTFAKLWSLCRDRLSKGCFGATFRVEKEGSGGFLGLLGTPHLQAEVADQSRLEESWRERDDHHALQASSGLAL